MKKSDFGAGPPYSPNGWADWPQNWHGCVSWGFIWVVRGDFWFSTPDSRYRAKRGHVTTPIWGPKIDQDFFSFFNFFWWNTFFGYLNRTENLKNNFYCQFITSFRVFEVNCSKNEFEINCSKNQKMQFKYPKRGKKMTVKITVDVFCTI